VDSEDFLGLIARLTGTPVKPLEPRERSFLAQALRDDGRRLGWTQFNELLLLVNKDRVEAPFYDRYFGRGCPIADVPRGVERFQTEAMLRYGNFVYACRTLARLRTREELESELGDLCRKPDELRDDFLRRQPKILEIEPIVRDKTFLVGYLSARETSEDKLSADILADAATRLLSGPNPTWDELIQLVSEGVQARFRPQLLALIGKYRTRHRDHDLAALSRDLMDDVLPRLQARLEEVAAVQQQAMRNQDVYLTWDHMDVYFATSMRKRWEFEDLFDFVASLMSRPDLAALQLRYFDPTQSFTKNRVNKGLVEALMLRRSKCTVYSVQDADTLGKDSELASTLAQGKPVIAYVPRIDVEERAMRLGREDPGTIQERLRFLAYAEEAFASSLAEDDLRFVRNFKALEEYEQARMWRSLGDEESVGRLRRDHGRDIDRLCRILAQSEQRLYNRRAETLTHSHPLGIQVHLETGVTNGVLVVRSVEQCAEVLTRVLTNGLEFDLEDSTADKMWYLRERISGCVYRVVTQDHKLTNCFWNFYPYPRK